MHGSRISQLHMAHFFHTVFGNAVAGKFDRHDHFVLLVAPHFANVADVTVGCLRIVFRLHHLVAHTEVVAADLQIGKLVPCRIDKLTDSGVKLLDRGRPFRTERREYLHLFDPVQSDLFAKDPADQVSGFLLRLALDELKILAVLKVDVRLIDALCIVGNEAALFLTEDLVEHRNGDESAVDQLTEDITGAHALQLVHITGQDNSRAYTDTAEELPCQPHIDHGAFVHDDEVGIKRFFLFILLDRLTVAQKP